MEAENEAEVINNNIDQSSRLSEGKCYIKGRYMTCPLFLTSIPSPIVTNDGNNDANIEGINNNQDDDNAIDDDDVANTTNSNDISSLSPLIGSFQCPLDTHFGGSYLPTLEYGTCQCNMLISTINNNNNNNMTTCDCYQCGLFDARFEYECYDAPINSIVGIISDGNAIINNGNCYNISCDGQCNVPIVPGGDEININSTILPSSSDDNSVDSGGGGAAITFSMKNASSTTRIQIVLMMILLNLYKIY